MDANNNRFRRQGGWATVKGMKMDKLKKHGISVALVFVALFVGGGGGAKLAGVEYVHHSFAVLGLPVWFGYFIGTCEVLGAIALFIRSLSALAAAGIACIMAGALYYHINYTPITQGIPAMVLLILCGLIFLNRRREMRVFG